MKWSEQLSVSQEIRPMISNDNSNSIQHEPLRSTDMLSLLRTVWNRKITVILIAFAFGLASYLVNTYLITATYRSSFTAYVNNRTDAASSNTEALTSGDTTAAQSLTYTYAEILRSDPILEQAADRIELDYSGLDLHKIVTTSIGENTQLVYVYVTMEDPALARDYAQAIADIAPGYLEDIVEGTSMKIVSTPKLPGKQYEPNIRRNTAVVAIAGLLAGIILVIVLQLSNTVISSKEELQELFEIPIIGTIPNFDYEAGHSSGDKYGYGYGQKPKTTKVQEQH